MRRKRDVDVFDMEIGGEKLVVVSLPRPDGGLRAELLSATERSVARDVVAGLSNAAIARKRARSARTVANQIASIYRKLGVSSRAELTARLLDEA
jgi:DNA-binding NarL/FixJ family response regulator